MSNKKGPQEVGQNLRPDYQAEGGKSDRFQTPQQDNGQYQRVAENSNLSNQQSNSGMRPPAGMSGLGPSRPVAQVSGAKGLKSIHTKVHNTASKAKNRHTQKPALDLDTPSHYEEGHVPGIGIGLKDEPGQQSQRSRGSRKDRNKHQFGFGTRTDRKAYPNGFNAQSSNKKAMIFSNPSEYFDNRQGEMIKESDYYQKELNNLEYPETPLCGVDYAKRLKFEELKRTRLEAMCHWKQKDVKGIKKNHYIKEIQKKNDKILTVVDKNDLEKREVYTDRFPLLSIRNRINKVLILIQMVASAIITSPLFDNISISVIILNSFIMMLDDPTRIEPDPFFESIENVFLGLYSVEMVLKIVGMGFYFNENAYIKDGWNILDFVIVTSSLPTALMSASESKRPIEEIELEGVQNDGGLSVGAFRAFRVLRPLKTISSVKGLKVLMNALFSAIPLLKDTMVILMFFFIILSIAGSNLMGGLLKYRCISIQTGKLEPSDMICGDRKCPGGYFCGKTNENPNFGVSNFDNVSYSMLAVFQSVTLEGWSDVQVMLQQAYTYLIFLYFTLIVFVGAFFLLNLTLAVINSKFTEAHNEQQDKDRALLEQQTSKVDGDNNDMDTAMNQKDEMSIAQFITARIYAKKMIEFLRMRQEIKRIEHDRMIKLKDKQEKRQKSNRFVAGSEGSSKAGETISIVKSNGQSSQGHTPKKISNGGNPGANIIYEEDQEQISDHSDREQLDKEINNFLREANHDMVRQGHHQKTVDIPRHTANGQSNRKDYPKVQIQKNMDTNGNGSGAPTMKGNIGPVKKNAFIEGDEVDQRQKYIFKKMAEEFDIDNVIPQAEQMATPNALTLANQKSAPSFDLSMEDYAMEDSHQGSSRAPDRNYGPANTMGKGISGIPGLEEFDNSEQENGLITSDSDFSQAEAAAGYNPLEKKVTPHKNKQVNLKKDVSKTFKKMLTSNHERLSTPNASQLHRQGSQGGDSTQYNASAYQKSENAHEFESQTQISEIESKFARKKKNSHHQKYLKGKLYKNDDPIEENYLEDKFQNKKDNIDTMMRTNKDDIRQLEEFISTKRPKDPFKDLDPLTQKVDISVGIQYKGTSQNDIFGQRIKEAETNNFLAQYNYIRLPEDMTAEVDPDFQDNGFVRSTFHPYQQKTVYQVYEDTSEEEKDEDAEEISENEDDLQAQKQPYETPAAISYDKMLNHTQILELARRSDIMITSTLSFNLITKDKRKMNQHFKKALMTHQNQKQELADYIDEKSAFLALDREHKYECKYTREKDSEMRTNYLKSFIRKTEFESKTLRLFKDNVIRMNTQHQKVTKKSKETERQEKLRHEQNKRASEKRGLPKFDMEMSKKLLDGKFHDEDEDDGDPLTFQNENKITYANEEDQIRSKLEKFQRAYNEIMDAPDERNEDEIPDNLRTAFHIPKKMGVYQIDFQAIRKDDISYKRQRPLWSGQDILREKLDNDKSQWVVDHISAHRVWPFGVPGLFKRLRFITRIKVKSSIFDNALTFAVLLNTITLSMVSATMTPELEAMLELANVWFTWIFIYEMFIKWYAVGIGKYFADTMNILDGGVVWLSIFEIVFQQVSQGSANLSAFRTIRMLRTFRVFRVARLLRALKSMQTIMAVIARSYKSFIYITVLMFLFVIIFSLLGMSLFGGTFNFVEGKPRGNYDSFQIAFVTIFQVLTMENWQSVLFDSMRSPMNPYFISVFYIMWIFLGNFILLNLFLAILLDSFLEEDEESDETSEEKEERLKKKRFLVDQKKRRLNKTKVFMSAMLEGKGKRHGKGPRIDSEEDLEDLDVEEIMKIYKSQGIIKKDKKEIQDQKLFVGIECKAAFYLFPQENKFREFCYKSCKSTTWENVVLVLILLSSGKLGFDTYLNKFEKGSIVIQISNYSDKIFNYAFIIEMITKLIAIGFIMDEGSYLRESWNQLDFFIVMSSIIDMSLDGFDLPALKILRMLRVLRPLRFITHNYELKMVVVALLDSVGGIFNVLIVVAVVYLIFAIMGVNFFMGTFVYCSIDPYFLHSEIQCLRAGGQWSIFDHNFDNVSNAMVTLFVVSSLEGWPDVMINSLDVTKINKGPEKEFNKKGMIFFIIFILIGSFFFLNFFIGVLFLNYNQAMAEENKGFTPKALGWMDIQRLILQAQPEYETTNVPKAPWRKWFHDLVSSQRFDLSIMFCIMLNMIQMAFIMEGITQAMQTVLDITNYIFTAVFIVEAICKIIAFGDTYLKLGWNKFDFFVVVSSILDLLLETLDTKSMEFLTVAPQLARVMRVLRVTRIIKLAGKQEGLQAIIQTIVFSLPSLGNVVILLGLIYFMFTIMGWFVFRNILEGDVISELKSFTTFVNGFLLVFALSTGEDWNKVMFDCTRTKADGCIDGINCGSNFAYLYFMLLVLVCSHVMLNLFILVIIQQFEKYYLPKENMITKFKNDLACFMKVWKELTQDRYRCHKIKENQLTSFFRRLGDFGDKDNSLGFSEEYFNDGELKKQVLKMAINSDVGYIYFNELLYRCMRKKYGNMKINKRMQVFELRTQFQIFLTTREKQAKTKVVDNEEIYNSIIKKENQVNPFLTVMNFKISYKTWLKMARQNIKKRARENSSVADMSTFQEEQPKVCQVEIEVEMQYSTTSEEDSQAEIPPQSTLGNNKALSDSNRGSSVNLGNMIKEKKKKDHLMMFEKKMTQKFKSLNTQSSMKKKLKAGQSKSVKLDQNALGLLSLPNHIKKE